MQPCLEQTHLLGQEEAVRSNLQSHPASTLLLTAFALLRQLLLLLLLKSGDQMRAVLLDQAHLHSSLLALALLQPLVVKVDQLQRRCAITKGTWSPMIPWTLRHPGLQQGRSKSSGLTPYCTILPDAGADMFCRSSVVYIVGAAHCSSCCLHC